MKIIEGLAEGQVLQRHGRGGATVKVLGECATSGLVLATISRAGRDLRGWTERRVGRAARGVFRAVLENIPAGGPYRLVLQCGSERARGRRFFVGDVWLLAGQSNMQGVGDMEGAAKPHPLIRVFSMRREWRRAEDPLHLPEESPDFCHSGGRQLSAERGEEVRRTARKGVGPGVFFAREMLERTGVPQGLIATAHGGTSMAQWDPALKKRGGDSLYGSMLISARATGQPVAGVLWHQGESDANEEAAGAYGKRMRALVAAVRRDLRAAGLPWIMVQLAGLYGGWGGTAWNSIQEQQRLLPTIVRGLETVSTIDLGLDDHIHLGAAWLPVLAARMARAADRLVLGNRREEPMPRLLRIVPPHPDRAPCHIDVVYAHAAGGLRSEGAPRGFVLLDGEGRELPWIYKTTLHGGTARLHFPAGFLPPGDTRLAYGHGPKPTCTITDARGCALPVFAARAFVRPGVYLPFLTVWRVGAVVDAPVVSLERMDCPDPELHGAETRIYRPDGFVNERPRWEGRTGHGYFAAKLTLAERMRLELMLGYDGPFRIWIDDEETYTDLSGTGPCLPDEFTHMIELDAGQHRLTVAMDLGAGTTWGFFLRMRRTDLAASDVRRGQFSLPVVSI